MQWIKIVSSTLKKCLCNRGTSFLSSFIFLASLWTHCSYSPFLSNQPHLFLLCGPTWLLSLCFTFIFFHPEQIEHMEEQFEDQLGDYVELDDSVFFNF
jgi:hypothetical protein